MSLTILLGVCLALMLVAVGLYQRALAYWKERAEELELELEAERIGAASVMSRVGAANEVTVEQSAGATTFEKTTKLGCIHSRMTLRDDGFECLVCGEFLPGIPPAGPNREHSGGAH